MSLVVTPGYVWVNGEVETATKLNLAATPTIADGQAGVFSTITATGIITATSGNPSIFGPGGTGVNNGSIILDGSSATNQGAFIRFSRNSVVKWQIGNESGISGGASDAFLLYDSAATATAFKYTTATGLAVTGALSATGFVTGYGCARAANDFTKSTDTTFADVPGLTINLISGQTYEIRIRLFLTSTGGNYKMLATGTSTFSSFFAAGGWFLTAYESVVGGVAYGGAGNGTATAAPGYFDASGTWVCNGSGTFKIQFAQNSASGSSVVRANSYISAKQIG